MVITTPCRQIEKVSYAVILIYVKVELEVVFVRTYENYIKKEQERGFTDQHVYLVHEVNCALVSTVVVDRLDCVVTHRRNQDVSDIFLFLSFTCVLMTYYLSIFGIFM